jgi:hypothetical protein
MRAWLKGVVGVCLAAIVGCGGGDRSELIENTVNKMSEASSALTDIKSKVNDFVRKKDSGKDEEGAKKDIEAAIADADQLEKLAKEWQAQIARTVPNLDEEQKKELARLNQGRISEVCKSLNEAHREAKKAVAEAAAKFPKDEQVVRLLQALDKADGEFAVVTRKK